MTGIWHIPYLNILVDVMISLEGSNIDRVLALHAISLINNSANDRKLVILCI